MRIDVELTLSSGEKLCHLTMDELKELDGSCGKLMSRIGRTPHYARKNRTNIQMLESDQRAISDEIQRRMALTVLVVGGLRFHWGGKSFKRWQNPDSAESGFYERWFIPTQTHDGAEPVCKWGRDCESEFLITTRKRLQMIEAGEARVEKLDDPLLAQSWDLSELSRMLGGE